MDRENTVLVYLSCLLVKQDVRPGYIPNIDGTNLIYRNQCVTMARRYFKLNTFVFGDVLLITKRELTQEEKEILKQGPSDSNYHTLLGNILGYECVDFFGPHITSMQRTSINYTINLINSDKTRLHLFAYVCPGTIEDSQITLSPENIEKANEYLNKIKSAFREDSYARTVVSKINMELSYVFPFPTIIRRDELMSKGVPLPPPLPPISRSDVPVSTTSQGGSKKYRIRRKTITRSYSRKNKGKSKRRRRT